LIVASNVFMYAQNPQKWFDNILAHTRFLVFQDLIIRKRSATPPFLGDDQDCMRYSYSTKGINSDFAMAFDLSKLEPRILYFRSYEGGRNEFHSASRIAPLHFCSIVQGESNCTLREISPVGYWNLRATLFWINFKSYFKNILYSTRSDRSKGGST